MTPTPANKIILFLVNIYLTYFFFFVKMQTNVYVKSIQKEIRCVN